MTLIYNYGLMVALIVIIMFLRPTYIITITVNTHHRARVTPMNDRFGRSGSFT